MWYNHYDPWGLVSSKPLFVLYDNGIILYRQEKEYKEVQIGEKEKNDILSYCVINDSVQKGGSTASDTSIVEKPSYVLTVNGDSAKSFIYYGDLNNQEERVNAPAALLKLHDFIINYRNKNARPWFPGKVAVYAQHYDYALPPSLKWPANWPDLKQSKKVDELVSVFYLDKKYFNEMKALLARRGNTQAIEINNRNYYVYYQLPIPGIDSMPVQ
ncbi:MAG: hypothetical protein ACJ751_29115 [Niastella sp.]|uniref:hypothetical protein n=1 Tax=Niastella sp. TaxID=1869183 RepID=UPI00389B2ADE